MPLKAVNIIALPAVHGDFDLSKLLQYLFHIYAPVFIYGFGAFVILEDLFLCHRYHLSFLIINCNSVATEPCSVVFPRSFAVLRISAKKHGAYRENHTV